MSPPKPASRPDKVTLWRYLQLFRRDILSAQPARLYRAWMAEFRTPFFRSYLVNQPDLVKIILQERPEDFPKSDRISEGLRPLLGQSVFLTNGEQWRRQRRIIDPAFERGRLKNIFPAMRNAGLAGVQRLQRQTGKIEIEAFTSHLAADVIFRTLFSIPITDRIADEVFNEFQRFQQAQPILNPAAFIRLPGWMPRFHHRQVRKSAKNIRRLIAELTAARAHQIAKGTAPDDLATKIMTQADPQTGKTFSTAEMVDQVAIFFLAGHETSASALAWAFYLLARYPEHQDRVASEAENLAGTPEIADLQKLKFTRNVFREALRLYPPVPMMVRQTTCPEQFRGRDIAVGSQIVISPWHLHRHERLWSDPDGFDPDRFDTPQGKQSQRDAFYPFSAGPRVCPGAGFAMAEGPLMLGLLLREFSFELVAGQEPVPAAHLTVRSQNGIWLTVSERK